ncbi:PorP/SprF family type IX secretion system membrane protein [Flavivirga aquatica]|uniref:PorP/SprF family type IX secretion system membrane protein n=1 Tax=Flavivirga aquatica TaxID=1849968 RepID=UPI001F0A8967|nr:PorP/SprF family type IX secretion system membrane protein [Flavivirga aquatica]
MQISHSQEEQDGVIAFSLPVRNSLKFNRYAINPTFSFVREQNKYISIYNKREWTPFDDAPQTYLFSYAGRFRENIGVGVALFQQNYGLLTTFGGILNFAYNAVLERESNLTFGVNLGVYNSGINEGKIIVNDVNDPSLQNIPSNLLLTANPGINYGTDFFDFGISVNNLVLYNINTSTLIEDNPEQNVQAHVMYTGYVNSRGFFDESKFTGLVRSEFKKDITVISGGMMLTVPKGIWGQAGYNTLYGISAGVGFNISSQIAVEYNYEKAVGDLTAFGNSHEITLAYKFKNRYRYNYSGDDEEEGIIIPTKRKRKVNAVRQSVSSASKVDRKAIAEAKAKERAAAAARLKAKSETRAKLAAAAKERNEAKINQDKAEQDAKAAAEEAARLKAEQDAKGSRRRSSKIESRTRC